MSPVTPRHVPRANERGIVLAAALMFVLLTSVLVITFMTTTTGERSQSSNVHTAKQALYSADAGVRTQQQLLANLAQAKLDSCVTNWNLAGSLPAVPIVSNVQQLFPAGTLAAPWAASATNPPFTASASIAFADSECQPQAQSFDFLFTIQSTGSVRSTGRRSVQSQGILRLSAARGSFADYLLFMDQFIMPDGSNIWFTSTESFDGRVHTNTGFKFAYKPTFQDQVTQVHTTATFYNNGNTPVVADANNNGTIDVPNFYGGFQRGQVAVPLPTDSYRQQNAALGLDPSSGSPPGNADINTALGLAGSGTPPNGIYLAGSTVGGAILGGIYIQGAADQLRMWADTLGNRQYVQITQGGTHRTIEVDRTGNTTRVWNNLAMAGSPATYVGVPQRDIIYGNGAISSLTGPDRNSSTGYVNPAVAENTSMLVAATGDVVIQGDLTCDNYNGKHNVLGIFSSGGAVRVGTGAPDNVNIDAFVMASNVANGQFTVDGFNTGPQRGSVNLRGGVVARFYGAFFTFDVNGNVATGYNRNFHYDRRGLKPPFYPGTNHFGADLPTARTTAWKEI